MTDVNIITRAMNDISIDIKLSMQSTSNVGIYRENRNQKRYINWRKITIRGRLRRENDFTRNMNLYQKRDNIINTDEAMKQ